MRIVKLVFAVALLTTTFALHAQPADARPANQPPTRQHCMQVWHANKPAVRFAAKQRCLAGFLRHQLRVRCSSDLAAPRRITVKGVRADSNQRKVIAWLINESRARRLPYLVAWSAIAATVTEAGARELDHGHGTSVGPLQLIDTHGTAAQRRTIEFSGNWYLNGAVKIGWRGRTAAQLAQAVERSGRPDAYGFHTNEARRTLNLVLGPCTMWKPKKPYG